MKIKEYKTKIKFLSKNDNLLTDVIVAESKNTQEETTVKSDGMTISNLKVQKEMPKEYVSVHDIKIIKKELKKKNKAFKIKSLFMGVLFLLELFCGIAYKFKLLLSYIGLEKSSLIYFCVNFCCLIIAFLLCFSFFKGKIFKFSKFSVSCETLLFLAIIIFFVHNTLSLIFFFFNGFELNNFYIGFLFFGLYLYLKDKYLNKKRVLKNFNFLSSSMQKNFIDLYDKSKLPSSLINSTNLKMPNLAYNKRSGFLTDFLKISYETSDVDKKSDKISFIVLILAFLSGFLSFILKQDILYSLNSIGLILLVGTPILYKFCFDLKVYSYCKKLLKKGAMLVGNAALKKFLKTDSIIIDSENLYPSDAIVLKSIKTFKSQIRIDEAILYAASVLFVIDNPLKTVFDKIIMGKKKILKKAIDVKYEDYMGVTGYIDGSRVLVGNRNLLKKYGIDPPSKDYEETNCSYGQSFTYFALNDELVSMFILEYLPNLAIESTLNLLEKNGIKLIVKTVDNNINLDKISSDFEVSPDNITILSYDAMKNLNKIEKNEGINTKAYLCIKNKFEAFAQSILGIRKLSVSLKLINITQLVGLFIELAVVLGLLLYGTVNQIGEIEFLLYNTFWLIVGVLF